jgi:hypothetical protein
MSGAEAVPRTATHVHASCVDAIAGKVDKWLFGGASESVLCALTFPQKHEHTTGTAFVTAFTVKPVTMQFVLCSHAHES